MRRRAAERLVTIIGEASGALADEWGHARPDLPLVEARGMRNRLSHEYWAVDRTCFGTSSRATSPSSRHCSPRSPDRGMRLLARRRSTRATAESSCRSRRLLLLPALLRPCAAHPRLAASRATTRAHSRAGNAPPGTDAGEPRTRVTVTGIFPPGLPPTGPVPACFGRGRSWRGGKWPVMATGEGTRRGSADRAGCCPDSSAGPLRPRLR